MVNRIAILFFSVAAMAFCDQEDTVMKFIIDSMTLVAENGECVAFREDYEDVIKKDIEIVREYDLEMYEGIKYRNIDYGTFSILFEEDFKVRNISITESGPRLLNGIAIGEPLEDFLEDLQDEPRYQIQLFDRDSYLLIDFTEFDMLRGGYTPGILVEYDENRKVSYIDAGWEWP